jgi:hypothetical protein
VSFDDESTPENGSALLEAVKAERATLKEHPDANAKRLTTLEEIEKDVSAYLKAREQMYTVRPAILAAVNGTSVDVAAIAKALGTLNDSFDTYLAKQADRKASFLRSAGNFIDNVNDTLKEKGIQGKIDYNPGNGHAEWKVDAKVLNTLAAQMKPVEEEAAQSTVNIDKLRQVVATLNTQLGDFRTADPAADAKLEQKAQPIINANASLEKANSQFRVIYEDGAYRVENVAEIAKEKMDAFQVTCADVDLKRETFLLRLEHYHDDSSGYKDLLVAGNAYYKALKKAIDVKPIDHLNNIDSLEFRQRRQAYELNIVQLRAIAERIIQEHKQGKDILKDEPQLPLADPSGAQDLEPQNGKYAVLPEYMIRGYIVPLQNMERDFNMKSKQSMTPDLRRELVELARRQVELMNKEGNTGVYLKVVSGTIPSAERIALRQRWEEIDQMKQDKRTFIREHESEVDKDTAKQVEKSRQETLKGQVAALTVDGTTLEQQQSTLRELAVNRSTHTETLSNANRQDYRQAIQEEVDLLHAAKEINIFPEGSTYEQRLGYLQRELARLNGLDKKDAEYEAKWGKLNTLTKDADELVYQITFRYGSKSPQERTPLVSAAKFMVKNLADEIARLKMDSKLTGEELAQADRTLSSLKSVVASVDDKDKMIDATSQRAAERDIINILNQPPLKGILYYNVSKDHRVLRDAIDPVSGTFTKAILSIGTMLDDVRNRGALLAVQDRGKIGLVDENIILLNCDMDRGQIESTIKDALQKMDVRHKAEMNEQAVWDRLGRSIDAGNSHLETLQSTTSVSPETRDATLKNVADARAAILELRNARIQAFGRNPTGKHLLRLGEILDLISKLEASVTKTAAIAEGAETMTMKNDRMAMDALGRGMDARYQAPDGRQLQTNKVVEINLWGGKDANHKYSENYTQHYQELDTAFREKFQLIPNNLPPHIQEVLKADRIPILMAMPGQPLGLVDTGDGRKAIAIAYNASSGDIVKAVNSLTRDYEKQKVEALVIDLTTKVGPILTADIKEKTEAKKALVELGPILQGIESVLTMLKEMPGSDSQAVQRLQSACNDKWNTLSAIVNPPTAAK